MGRIYTVQFTQVNVTAQQDLFMVAPAANRPIFIHSLFVGQSSDAGDAQDEQLALAVIRGHNTVGSGGTSFTAIPYSSLDVAAGFTARVNDTTIASGGTPVTLHSDAFNVRAGYQLIQTPELRWPCSAASTRILVRLLTTPVDSLTMSGTLMVEEPF